MLTEGCRGHSHIAEATKEATGFACRMPWYTKQDCGLDVSGATNLYKYIESKTREKMAPYLREDAAKAEADFLRQFRKNSERIDPKNPAGIKINPNLLKTSE